MGMSEVEELPTAREHHFGNSCVRQLAAGLLAVGIDQALANEAEVIVGALVEDIDHQNVRPQRHDLFRHQGVASRHRVRAADLVPVGEGVVERSEEHTSELQSLMRISYAVFCLKKKKT